MRKVFFDTANKFEPYTALFSAGATPDSVKEAVVSLLSPYIRDKSQLQKLAVSELAVEAIVIGQLSSRKDWKRILDQCFDIRERAIKVNEHQAFLVTAHFEQMIREAKSSFALLVVFEVPKDKLDLNEFTFELFRTLGGLIETNIQPYIKELYCLHEVASGTFPDLSLLASEDFGQVCERFQKVLHDNTLLRPEPWGLRLNQWRNIAQHHSHTVTENSILATYGKSIPPKKILLTRTEMLALAQELMRRLGALKSSREIVLLNHIDNLKGYLPDVEPGQYNHATALAASFATQGFRLLDLQILESQAVAVLEDVAPSSGNERPIHCSQFVATIASRFPGVAVQLRYIVNGRHSWTFEATAQQLEQVMALENPLTELAKIVSFKNER